MHHDERNISHSLQGFLDEKWRRTTANIYKNNVSPACLLQRSVANTYIYYTHTEASCHRYSSLCDKFCNAHHQFFILLFFCSFPGATNDTLLEKFHQNHKNSDYYVMPMRRESTFTVKHYAGQVKYHIRVSFTSLLVAVLFLWNYTRQWVWVCTNLNLLKLCIEHDQGTLIL